MIPLVLHSPGVHRFGRYLFPRKQLFKHRQAILISVPSPTRASVSQIGDTSGEICEDGIPTLSEIGRSATRRAEIFIPLASEFNPPMRRESPRSKERETPDTESGRESL